MRSTSLAAYHKITASGLITGVRRKVFDIIYKYGPITMNEVFIEYLSDIPQATQTPRYAELEKMNSIGTVGKHPDRHTGVEGVLWDITGENPKKLPKRIPKKQQTEQVKYFLRTIYSKIKDTEPIDLEWFTRRSKHILNLLETGVENNANIR